MAKVWNREGAHQDIVLEDRDEESEMELSITQHGKLQGTVAFMSPEQVERRTTIDARTDLYSLGVVLYEILCGQLPVQGSRVDEVIDAIIHGVPAKPSELTRWKVPKQLEALTMACLEKDPDRRISSADDLVRELQQDWSERREKSSFRN